MTAGPVLDRNTPAVTDIEIVIHNIFKDDLSWLLAGFPDRIKRERKISDASHAIQIKKNSFNSTFLIKIYLGHYFINYTFFLFCRKYPLGIFVNLIPGSYKNNKFPAKLNVIIYKKSSQSTSLTSARTPFRSLKIISSGSRGIVSAIIRSYQDAVGNH